VNVGQIVVILAKDIAVAFHQKAIVALDQFPNQHDVIEVSR
jgi:hypothetical protein